MQMLAKVKGRCPIGVKLVSLNEEMIGIGVKAVSLIELMTGIGVKSFL